MSTMNEDCGENQDSSYDSSGGLFPDGYCIWKGSQLISSHCKAGYGCGGAPPTGAEQRFEGECVKVACVPKP